MEIVEEYSNCFKKLYKKVDPNNRTLAANTIWQFLSRLNPIIILLIYIGIPADLQVAINTAKSIKVGYKIT